MKGIDVSIFQGEVDWLSVRNAGIEFALIKCSQGGFTNSSAISPFTDRYFKRTSSARPTRACSAARTIF